MENNNNLCQNCKHFFVTWDPKAPKGCRKFNMKTTRIPCQLVRLETGEDCLGYEAKKSAAEQKQKPKSEFDDDSLW